MRNITLVCTVHEEKGRCNVSGLYEILERVQPEVIFLEIPRSFFDQYFKEKSRSNLETTAVNRYLESHKTELVPVDIYEVSDDFFEKNRRLHQEIESSSSEYRRLVDWHSQYVKEYGYAYLNSEHCTKLWSDIYKCMEEAIDRIDKDELFKTYELWKQVIEHRDNEMMENIFKYSKAHEFRSAAFLVGASHRQSIIEKTKSPSELESIRPKWNYSDYEGLF